MVWIRKKRSTTSKRKFMRRKMVRGRIPRRLPARLQTHYYKRKSSAAILTGATGGIDLYGSAYYSLSSVNGYTDFTALYDRYRIVAVKTTFVWNNNSGSIAYPQAFNSFPVIHTLVDYNDATAPTSVNALLENSRTKSFAFSNSRNIVNVYFKPKPLVMLWNQAAGTQQAAGVGDNTFKDVIHSNISHYGIKWCIENLGEKNEITVYHTYYLAFKDAK